MILTWYVRSLTLLVVSMPSLPNDPLTGGLLSHILTDTWLCEKQGDRRFLTRQELEWLHELLTNNAASLFGRVPESIFVPLGAFEVRHPDGREALTGLERNMLLSNSDMETRYIKFFDEPGFILHDGMYASAFGKFHYVYRAKGMRIIWTTKGTLRVCALYATIDHAGFSLAHEEIDAYELMSEYPDDGLASIYGWVGEPEEGEDYDEDGDVYFWVKQLANINKPYDRAYFIEYLVDPPDVRALSDFSIEVRRNLWRSIFQFAGQSLTQGITLEQQDLIRLT